MATTEYGSIGEVDGYPGGLPKKYRPIVDELRRQGYSVTKYHESNYGKEGAITREKPGDPVMAVVLFYFWMEEDRGVACQYDILDTPWWASVQKRQEQEFQAAVNERVMLERITAAQRQMDVARQEMERILRMRSETISLVDAKTTAEEAWMRGEARKP